MHEPFLASETRRVHDNNEQVRQRHHTCDHIKRTMIISSTSACSSCWRAPFLSAAREESACSACSLRCVTSTRWVSAAIEGGSACSGDPSGEQMLSIALLTAPSRAPRTPVHTRGWSVPCCRVPQVLKPKRLLRDIRRSGAIDVFPSQPCVLTTERKCVAGAGQGQRSVGKRGL